ncbi:MAG TPA: hypothetical protein VFT82_03025 [Candidatus Paceibacterota bacterium]|nr:hypothetical protein [Candidatus Paceibacterota bacterium]
MGEHVLSKEAYTRVADSVRSEGGSATRRGEQRLESGKGLDPLVDPKGFGAIRRSISRKEKRGDHFVLTVGTAMLLETQFDGTSSMRDNVDLAFGSLPKGYHLLKEADNAPLARYDLQNINGVFNDIGDSVLLTRSQAEMDEKIAEQLRLLIPCRAGGDIEEDPHYGLFGAAYLTAAEIVKYGLKSYHFTATDAPGRHETIWSELRRVYGDDVLDIVESNGFQMKKGSLPSTTEIVAELLKRAHAFVIQIGSDSDTARFWTEIYGPERVVTIPTARHIAETEAAIVGLTEGTLDLQGLEEFLVEEGKLSHSSAGLIREAVAGIPIGAQAALPNFGKIPLKGAKFAQKSDLWPIDAKEPAAAKPAVKAGPKKGMWRP